MSGGLFDINEKLDLVLHKLDQVTGVPSTGEQEQESDRIRLSELPPETYAPGIYGGLVLPSAESAASSDTEPPKPPQKPVVCPFTVLIDGREKAPYSFTGLLADANKNNRPLEIATKWAHLKTGDYSIEGMQNLVCVERKSLEDLYGSVGQHRERFEAEHQRMACLAFACVIVEADWNTILHPPPLVSRMVPRAVFATALAWQMRYGVPWMAMPDRRAAEITTFRVLEMFFRQQQRQKKESER